MKKETKKKKLVLVWEGAHKIFWSWCDVLNRNFDFYLILNEGGENDVFSLNNPITYVEAINFLTLSAYYKGLSKRLKEIKPDIILSYHINQLHSWQAASYCKRNNIPFYILETQIEPPTKVNPMFKLASPVIRFMYKNKLKKILCLTKKSFVYMKKCGFENVDYVPITPFFTFPKKQEYDNEDEKIKLLFVGRLVKEKNLLFVLEAIKELKNENKINLQDFIFNIVGSGPKEELLREYVIENDLKDLVSFLGWIKHEDLKDVYRENDIFILPSSHEILGLVVLEAMSAGLPILVSDKAGICLQIENNKNGYIFKSGDISDLKNKILQLKDNRKREQFGEQSFNLIKDYQIEMEKAFLKL